MLSTGTDNVPFQVPTLNTPVMNPGAPTMMASAGAGAGATTIGAGIAQPDYSGSEIPRVWRTNRTQAAAKVDALSSGGMDDLEIPAFLRKQAD